MRYRATVYLTVMHIIEVNADDSNEAEVEAMAIAELKGSEGATSMYVDSVSVVEEESYASTSAN